MGDISLLQNDDVIPDMPVTWIFTEWESPCHRPVRQGGGKEVQKSEGGGAVGEFGEGLSGLRGTVGECDIVQTSSKGADVRG